MNASAFIRTAAKAIAPAANLAAKRAMTEGAIGGAAKTTGKVSALLYAVPPALVIFGYGGIMVYSENGALGRIHRSFAAIPRDP